MTSSAALTTDTDQALREHLLRRDGQEDLCFALHRPSQGHRRHSFLVSEPILPEPGEREVHGNAGFRAEYFLRAAERAAEAGLDVVMDHCIKIEHGRYYGEMHWFGLNTGIVTSRRPARLKPRK